MWHTRTALLTLLLTLSLTLTTSQLTPPPFPHSYSTLISANFLDHAFTFAYEEHWSGNLTVLRYTGRFHTPLTAELFDFSSGTGYQWQASDSDSRYNPAGINQLNGEDSAYTPSCTSHAVSKEYIGNATHYVRNGPIGGLFQQWDLDPTDYIWVGQTREVRGILCNKFLMNVSLPVQDIADLHFNATMNYYVAVSGLTGISTVPVRLNVTLLIYNLTELAANASYQPTVDRRVYDFESFVAGEPNPLLLVPPLVCALTNETSNPVLNLTLFTRPNPTQPPPATMNMPALPKAFRADVEGALTSIVNGNVVQDIVNSFRWYFDNTTQMQRFDYDDTPLQQQVTLITNDAKHTWIKSSTCVESNTTIDTPLQSFRGGCIQALFQQPGLIR